MGMRNLLLVLPFFAIIAFAQDPPSKLLQGADNPPQDAASKSRIRADGSAGGTGQELSDEAKRGVGSGAGPHRTAPRADYKRRAHSEKPSPGDQGSERQSERQGEHAGSGK
jgi:hypothetical protein